MITFELPAGPVNIQPLFPGVDMTQVDEYYLQLKSGEDILLTTNHYKRSCCCGEDSMRLFFVNYLGRIDSLNLKYVSVETDVKSAQWKKPLKLFLEKWNGGTQRSSINAAVIVTGESNCYFEEDQEWLDELMTTPNAWIQWTGTQGQSDNYLPVVIADTKFLKRKNDDRYEYPLQVQFVMANDKIVLRS